MDVGSQDPIRKLDESIPNVDDGVVRKRLDMGPGRVVAGRQNLQAAEPIEEDGDAAKVCVLPKRNLLVINRLRRGFDHSDMVSAGHVYSVHGRQRPVRKLEELVEQPEKQMDNILRGPYEFLQEKALLL